MSSRGGSATLVGGCGAQSGRGVVRVVRDAHLRKLRTGDRSPSIRDIDSNDKILRIFFFAIDFFTNTLPCGLKKRSDCPPPAAGFT